MRQDGDCSGLELFYVQNIGYCGNCLFWWREGGHGYTCNLDEAWKLTREQADDICRSRPHEDKKWLVSFVDRLAGRHLDCEVARAALDSSKQARPENVNS